MNLVLQPTKIFRSLFIFIIILLVANITVQFIFLNYYVDNGIWSDNKWVKVIINLFDLNREQNIPTFYSALALFFSSVLLWLIAQYNKKNKLSYLPWLGLSFIFIYLSVDELVELHEHLVHLTRNFLNLSGMGTGYWTIPYIIIVLVLAVIYYRFLLSLPKKTIKFFIIAGVVFITGAAGFEIIGERIHELNGRENALYKSLQTCEEFLEMLGIVIFIYALTSYKSFTLKIE